MKRTFLLVGVFLLAVSTLIRAQTVTVDTVYADVVLDSVGATGGFFVVGKPDGKQVQIPAGNEFYIQLGLWDHPTVTFNSGATLEIFWTKLNVTDSEAAFMQFVTLSPQGFETRRLATNFLIDKPGVVTFQVPDTGYNTLVFTPTNNGTGGIGATVFYLDAVALHQRLTAGVDEQVRNSSQVLLENYPNPFVTSNGTSIRMTVPKPGDAVLVLTDLLGRGISIAKLGELLAGSQDVRVEPSHPGTYIARLQINGEFVGAPLKITAQ